MIILKSIFCLCGLLIIYVYLIYMLLICFLDYWFALSTGETPDDPEDWPEVTLLIAAYNEEAVIEERIRNALAMDYPRERLEIVIGLDGCTDNTAAIAQRFVDRSVSAARLRQTPRQGHRPNAAMAEIQSPIVLMSDANTDIDPQAARRLVRWFQDPWVGAVVRTVDPDRAGHRQ